MKNILCTNCNNTGDNVLVYAPDQITPEMLMNGLEKGAFLCRTVTKSKMTKYNTILLMAA